MRIMVTFSFANPGANELVRSGKIAEVFGHLMEDLKPEAAYFFPEGGERGGLVVVNVQDSSEVAGIGERFWFGMGAQVEMRPVMNGEDLQRGLAGVPGIVQRYA